MPSSSFAVLFVLFSSVSCPVLLDSQISIMRAATRTARQSLGDGAREGESQGSDRHCDVSLCPLVVREGRNRGVRQGLLISRRFFGSSDG